MTGKMNRHAISGAFVFLLLGMFAVFSTVLVLFGAQAYRGIVVRNESHGAGRILHNFLMNTVRSNDGAGVIGTEEIDGHSVLSIANTYDGEVYITRVYCADGELRELFTDSAREFDPDEGERIAAAEDFSAELADGVLTMCVTDAEGRTVQLHMAVRTSDKEVTAP